MTQEVFLRALRHLDGYESASGSFRPYLMAVARNLARDRWRSQQRQARGGEDPTVVADLDEGPEAAILAAEQRAELIVALAQLPPEYQRVLRLRLIEGQSAAEVAAVLGRTSEAVRQLQHRALAALRAGLTSEREPRVTND